jgi:hypothetical protein
MGYMIDLEGSVFEELSHEEFTEKLAWLYQTLDRDDVNDYDKVETAAQKAGVNYYDFLNDAIDSITTGDGFAVRFLLSVVDERVYNSLYRTETEIPDLTINGKIEEKLALEIAPLVTSRQAPDDIVEKIKEFFKKKNPKS